MAGPIIALQFFFLIFYFCLILFLFFYTIRKRHSLKKSIPSGILFLGLTSFGIYMYCEMKRNEYEASKKFLGYYKLDRLDSQKCDSCKVRLKEGYTYDIIVKDKIVGHGKWQIGTAVDIPGLFIKIENGPSIFWSTDTIVNGIDHPISQ